MFDKSIYRLHDMFSMTLHFVFVLTLNCALKLACCIILNLASNKLLIMEIKVFALFTN